jgi:hypothetical protein
MSPVTADPLAIDAIKKIPKLTRDNMPLGKSEWL